MKINWGTGLLIFFILYIGNLVRVVVKSTTIDHSLVEENYYEHDIHFQEKLDKIKNRKLLAQDLNITYNQTEKKLKLDFGEQSDFKNAQVHLYRASDKSSDFNYSIDNTADAADIDLETLIPGKWQVKVEWADNARSYFKEQDIYIQKL
ncbi:FixH family protein [Portibacter lacus]|uniref:Cytochrome Cbb3 oxidase maturation protein CcoH n=1 Tax=Portibacter lacus TaxID=1099794 RepID=A0AA37WEE9_9BACT|nr:FixH family protein [Portibacter lacus]GLR17187.1 cytochrome Cbb3 oxidase maturation protein CcoH [Portibacter lacus]